MTDANSLKSGQNSQCGKASLSRRSFVAASVAGAALPLIAFPLLYNNVFLVGTMNYVFGIGLALWALTAWVGLRERNPALRFLVSAAFEERKITRRRTVERSDAADAALGITARSQRCGRKIGYLAYGQSTAGAEKKRRVHGFATGRRRARASE